MRRLLLSGALGMFALLTPNMASGTDIPIFPTGPVYQLKGLVWGTSVQPGFNNNYFFTPVAVNESVCVYVYNQNPTTAHTFTASISVNGNPANITPSDGTWQLSANSTALSAPVSPGLPAGIGASVTGAAIVSINLSNSSTQAGNPDVANVTVLQTPGSCFSGNQFIGSAPQTLASVPAVQAISEGLSQGFTSTPAGTITNPANGQLVLHVGANNGARSIYFDKVIIACSAACSVGINYTSTNGTTCTGITPINQHITATPTSTAISQTGACGANPGVFATYNTLFPLAAGVPATIDLRGLIASSGSNVGSDIVMAAALTGTISATYSWYEK